MNACSPSRLAALSDGELEVIAAGETDAPECEVQLALTLRLERERDRAEGPEGE